MKPEKTSDSRRWFNLVCESCDPETLYRLEQVADVEIGERSLGQYVDYGEVRM